MTKEKRITERQERQLDAWDLVRQEAGERENLHQLFLRASTVRFQTRTSITLFVSFLVQTKEKKGALQCKALQLAALWQAMARHVFSQGARESKRMKRTSLKKTIWGVVRCPPPPTGTQHHTTPGSGRQVWCTGRG